MEKYIIVPGCSDLNRGDQALAWETKRLGEDAGFVGEYYLISEKNEPVNQSKQIGLKIIFPILEHPSRKFKNKENVKYTKSLKIKWGIVSLFDMLKSFFLLCNFTRPLFKLFLTREKKETLKIFQEANAIFMKGGGLLQTYGGISSTYSMYFWVYSLLLAHKMKKNVYIMPNSFGPFEGPFVKFIAKRALKKCKVVSTRETISKQALYELLKIKATNYADLAFYLEKSNMNKNDLFKRFNIPLQKKLVALTMRPYRFPKSKHPEKAYEYFKREFATFIKWLYKNDYIPVLVEHTLAVNSHENDGACINDVIKLLNKEEYFIISDKSFNCKDMKCIYSYFDYIVGTRFHSLIFSLSCNVPGIAISYTGHKAPGIMHDIGLDDYVIDIYDVSSDILIKKFQKMTKEKRSIKAKITKYKNNIEGDRNNLISECRGE